MTATSEPQEVQAGFVGASFFPLMGALARQLGLDPGTVAAWERDEVRRPYPRIRRTFEGYLRRQEVPAEP